MAKISRITKMSYSDWFKQKKLEKMKIQKMQEAAVQAAKEAEFDAFVRQTARDMLKGISKYQLQVNNGVNFNSQTILSESSVWAPWSKMFQKS